MYQIIQGIKDISSSRKCVWFSNLRWYYPW